MKKYFPTSRVVSQKNLKKKKFRRKFLIVYRSRTMGKQKILFYSVPLKI
jgi:hypothetical protein